MISRIRRLEIFLFAHWLIVACSMSLALARASLVTRDAPWNSEHIDQLPIEIRQAVDRMCGQQPRAAHYFVTYLQDSRRIKLHFEHLWCGAQRTFCAEVGCLHQEYVSSGGRYRLFRSYYGRDND